jgi:hypothetical protein
MTKLTLNPINSRYGSIDALNDNFAAIEAALENTLSRDGTVPNFMEYELDMNSRDIINVKDIYVDGLYIDGVQVDAAGYGLTVENVFQTSSFVATAGQTVFDVGVPIEYSNSTLIVMNGLTLAPSDFIINGTTVVLAFPALLGDEVVVRRFTKRVYNTNADEYRFENQATFDLSFSIGNGRNAMSAGPITILDNVVVTIPSGSSWHII